MAAGRLFLIDWLQLPSTAFKSGTPGLASPPSVRFYVFFSKWVPFHL